jgi:four helix bundle protein
MKDLSGLRVYKLAVEIGELVWNEVHNWEQFAKWTIGKQIVDSADSISSNIIEGYYRHSSAEKRKFFQYSLASSKETALWFWKAKERKLVSSKKFLEFKNIIDNFTPQMINLILKSKQEKKV